MNETAPHVNSPTPLDELSPHPVMLAPMVGITHFVLRQALQEQLPTGAKALWPTEMLSSRRIPSQEEAKTIEVIFKDRDHGLCPQLLGNEESFIRDSVYKLQDWGARAIDINMGCPVSKALRHNYGVALMGDVDYAAEVTHFAVKHSKLPVSVKLRAGLQGDIDYLLKFCKALEAAGASWITLHPRTAAEKRRGKADWNQIKLLKETLKIPVVGNGDIQTLEDIQNMKSQTGADRVMIGRALLAKPWLLQLKEPQSPFEQSALYHKFVTRLVELSREHYPEREGMKRLRFVVFQGSTWLEFGHSLYKNVVVTQTYDEFQSALDRFFESPQKMMARTDLRH